MISPEEVAYWLLRLQGSRTSADLDSIRQHINSIPDPEDSFVLWDRAMRLGSKSPDQSRWL